MAEKYDEETKAMMSYAVEDLQAWMASTGADATESAMLAWQQGYIAGANRAMGIKDGQS